MIEEEFFKVFGIEPDCSYLFLIERKGTNESARTLSLGSKSDLKRFIVNCGGKGRVVKSTNSPHIYYPEITAEKLLDIASILMLQFQVLFYFDYEHYFSSRFSNNTRPICNQCNSFKELIIKTITSCGKIETLKKEIEPQVRKLFEEK